MPWSKLIKENLIMNRVNLQIFHGNIQLIFLYLSIISKICILINTYYIFFRNFYVFFLNEKKIYNIPEYWSSSRSISDGSELRVSWNKKYIFKITNHSYTV